MIGAIFDPLADGMIFRVCKRNKLSLGDLVSSVLPWPFHKDLPDKAYCGGKPKISLCELLLLAFCNPAHYIFIGGGDNEDVIKDNDGYQNSALDNDIETPRELEPGTMLSSDKDENVS